MYSEKDRYFINYLLNHLPHCLFWKDKNLIFQGCNKQFAEQFGYKNPAEIVGLTDNDFPWTPELRDKYINDDTEILASGKAKLDYEEEQKQPDGSIKTVLVSKVPVFDENNKVVGILGIYTDITERKKAEEYRLKHEAAQKVISFTNLMAGSIAHELRTPLAGIKVNMENLRDMDFEKILPQIRNESLKQIAESVIKSIDATSHIIDDMLIKVRSFATGDTHHNEFEEISITADIENLLEVYPFNNNEQELVKVTYGARFKYLGDKGLTYHVLTNLLKNALHAIRETDKTNANITIETKTRGNFNLLIFRDTATGVPKDFIGKIFNQFETKKTTHGGTGLGLAFCKSVMVDAYGGNITCNSEEGKYTEFVLSFPKIKPQTKALSKTQLKKSIAKK
jgi:PAS domain S-box-containing protein